MMNQYEIDYQQGYDKANDKWLERIEQMKKEFIRLSEGSGWLDISLYCCLEIIDKYKAESEDDDIVNRKLKELFERVENIEKQIKEDKEEQLKKLKAELDYAKFRCNL